MCKEISKQLPSTNKTPVQSLLSSALPHIVFIIAFSLHAFVLKNTCLVCFGLQL
jgi:hypothetical protein